MNIAGAVITADALPWNDVPVSHTQPTAATGGSPHAPSKSCQRPDLDTLPDLLANTDGVILVAGTAVRVIMTLNFLHDARDRQVILMDDRVFRMRVNARNIVELPIAGLAVGPAGTPASELESALDVVDDA